MAGKKRVSAPPKKRKPVAATKDDLLALKQELKRDLDNRPTKADLANHPTKADLKAALENYPTKADLKAAFEGWAAALAATLRSEFRAEMQAMRVELNKDLARHVNAANESMRTQLAAVDDKYAELPGRVAALEDERG